jgi:hypothetical protein
MKTLEDNLCGLVDEFRNLSAVAETRTIYVSCGGQDKTESKLYNPPPTTPLFRGIVTPYSGQSSPPF